MQQTIQEYQRYISDANGNMVTVVEYMNQLYDQHPDEYSPTKQYTADDRMIDPYL